MAVADAVREERQLADAVAVANTDDDAKDAAVSFAVEAGRDDDDVEFAVNAMDDRDAVAATDDEFETGADGNDAAAQELVGVGVADAFASGWRRRRDLAVPATPAASRGASGNGKATSLPGGATPLAALSKLYARPTESSSATVAE